MICAKEFIDKFGQIYNFLEDQESRETYMARIHYLITGDFGYYRRIIHKYLADVPPINGTAFDELLLTPPAADGRKIVLYGTGDVGRLLFHSVYKDDKRFIGFCSRNKEKQKYGFLGYPVMAPEELLKQKSFNVVISADDCGKRRNRTEIRRILLDGGYPGEQIYEFDKRKEGIQRYDPSQYFAPDFIKYQEEEILIDGGCYNLDSALEMRRHCKNLKKVYAFEPDPISYKHCLSVQQDTGFEQVKMIQAGTWNSKTTLSFEIGNDGGSSLAKTGEISVPVVTIDETVMPEDRITYIKLDVEGAELESLEGARITIQKCKPKLAVCLYHKPEDLITLPLYIKGLVPEYKLYVRHHSNVPEETVLYAVIP